MDKLTAIRIKYDDGTYSQEMPVYALAENVEWDDTHTLVDILGNIDVDITGTIQDQISQLVNNKLDADSLNQYVSEQLNTDVTNWLNNNVNPVGSAVVVDNSLSIQGAAADAKVVGDELTDLKADLSTFRTEVDLNLVEDEYVAHDGDIASYSGWSRTDYIDVSTASAIYVNNSIRATDYCHFYDAEKNPIGNYFNVSVGNNIILTNGAKYVVISNRTGSINQGKMRVWLPLVDLTLTENGKPADAKATGEAIEAAKVKIDSTLGTYGAAADAKAVGLIEDGYYVFQYNRIQNSYPNNKGVFVDYEGWDRTDYIPVTQSTVYFDNPTRTSSDNAMYDENKNFLGRFTVIIGEKIKISLSHNTRYIVVSNNRNDFYQSIYEESPINTTLIKSVSDIDEHKISIEKLNCSIFDWSLFASDTYPLGWRTGCYDISTGEGNDSTYYLRTFKTSSIIKMIDGAKYFSISVPSGYAVSVSAYDENTDEFIRSWGNPDVRSIIAVNELTIEVVHGYNYKFTVGRFSGNDSEAYINDSDLINSFVLKVYWDKNNDDILQYYFPYIQNRVDKINEIRRTSSLKSFSFIFVTDYHSIRNAKQSHKLIKYICKNTGISDVIFGGDAFQNWRNLSQSMREISKVYDTLRDATNGRFFCVYGNHEWNDITGQEDTAAGVTQMTVRSLYGVGGIDELGDYYVDNEICKTRIFFLACDVAASIPWESILWLGNQLNSIPSGYFAMVICHCGILNGSSGIYQKNTYEQVSKLLGAYDKHTIVTLADGGGNIKGSFNYTASTGNAICYLSGHVHEDLVITKAADANGVLAFTTTGDLYKNASGTHYSFVNEEGNTLVRNVGTIYENAFDVIHIDTVARKIYCIRIGAGVDREFEF